MTILAVAGLAALLLIVWVAVNVLRGRGVVRLVEVACAATIVIAALSSAFTVLQSLVSNTTTVVVSLTKHIPDVRIPGLTIDKPAAVIVGGGVDRATMTVTGLSWASRLLLTAETLTQAAVTIVIALVVLRLARNVRAGKPFSGLARSLIHCAVVLFLGALIWSVVGGIGSYMAGREALEIHSMSASQGSIGFELFPETPADLSYFGWPDPALFISIPFWPLGIAAALALLGAAFRTGERLQADTDGLI